MKLNSYVFTSVMASSLALIFFASPATAANFARPPDATINSSSLFDLPKDIVSTPMLKDLLTEDFVFYYRDSGADWLSFRGALARIAFENQIDWPTKIVSWILNGPAEIALWKGDDGKLKHFMAVIDQTAVKDLMGLIARIAANDSQLKSEVQAGSRIYHILLSTGRTVYLAAEDSRLFLYTDPAMKIPNKSTARTFLDQAKAFLGVNRDVSLFGPKLGKSKHVITFTADYLSFGYQAFFDSFKAVQFDFVKNESWSTQVLTSSKNKSVDAKNWSRMPKGAAFCLTVPLNLEKMASVIKAEKWIKKAQDSAIGCWYPDSKLYTPVFAIGGEFADLIKQPDDFKKLFESTIGVREVIWKAAPKAPGESEDAEKAPPVLAYLPMLPITKAKLGPGQIGFIREVGGRYGVYPSSKSLNPKLLGSRRFFRVKAVATSDVIVFSPDDQLVDKTLMTVDGKFPSMAVEIPKGAKSPMIILVPDAISKLAKNSILESLPSSQEAIFRTAVSRHLFPNLEKFGKRPVQAASLTGNGEWKNMEWTANATR